MKASLFWQTLYIKARGVSKKKHSIVWTERG